MIFFQTAEKLRKLTRNLMTVGFGEFCERIVLQFRHL